MVSSRIFLYCGASSLLPTGKIAYTVTLARANAGDFTSGPHVNRPHTQFTCVTCSLPDYRACFTNNIKCGTHTNYSPATGMQSCLLLLAKLHAIYKQNAPAIVSHKTGNRREKHRQSHTKVPIIPCSIHHQCSNNTRNSSLKHPQVQGILLSHRG